MATTINLDEFTRAYIECALWSTNDESDESGGVPFDENYSSQDISAETMEEIIADCANFQADNESLLTSTFCIRRTGSVLSQAGHDFWLTRNGHGAGFWDGDWEKQAGDKLTKASKAFGEINLYVGDDGKIYS